MPEAYSNRIPEVHFKSRFVGAVLLLACLLSVTSPAAQNPPYLILPERNLLQDEEVKIAQRAFVEAEKLFQQGSAESVATAITKYQEALQIHQSRGNRFAQYLVLIQLGVAYQWTTAWQQALACFRQALALSLEMKNQLGEINSLFCIAIAYHYRGDKQKAIDYYQQTIQRCQETKNRVIEVDALNKLGIVYDQEGDTQKALELFNRALSLGQEINSSSGQAETLVNMASIYDLKGERQKALDAYTLALSFARQANSPGSEAQVLAHLGSLYDSFGETELAVDYYTRAMGLWRKSNDPFGEADTLNSLGVLHDSLGEYDKALAYLTDSLSLHKRFGNRKMEALTLSNLARFYLHKGAHKEALDTYQQALKMSLTIADQRNQAIALRGLGLVYDALGELDKALEFFHQALLIFQFLNARHLEEDTLYCIALTLKKQGKLDEARERVEATLKLTESFRSQLANRELRSSWFALRQKLYELYIDLLMSLHDKHPSQGFDVLAFQASERARARSLLESLAEAVVDLKQGIDPALLEKEQQLRQLLNAKASQQEQLLAGKHSREEAEAKAREINALTHEYQQIQAQMRQRSPRYAALVQPEPLSLQKIQQQVLDKDTLLLEYALGSERSYMWAVTTNSIKSYRLPPRSEIEDQARRVYDLLTWRQRRNEPTGSAQLVQMAEADANYWREAVRLSHMILSAVTADLGSQRLLLVTHGALQYLPFAALPKPVVGEGKSVAANEQRKAESISKTPTGINRLPAADYRPLILDHEIVSLPSASVLSVLRRDIEGRSLAPRQIAVFADPVFEANDPRIKTVNATSKALAKNSPPQSSASTNLQPARRNVNSLVPGKLSRLPFTRQEAQAILGVTGGSANLSALDFKANRTLATTGELNQYRIIHFATHGILNTRHPELSSLVLSLFDEAGRAQDGFFRLNEIYNLRLSAEVVTLSACQSALGKEIRGEGLVGITRGFMYAGAPRVVASLWQVDDYSTAELMSRFYKGMLQGGLRPAAALRAAQLEMFNHKQRQAPYYWAAFVLQGEWQ